MSSNTMMAGQFIERKIQEIFIKRVKSSAGTTLKYTIKTHTFAMLMDKIKLWNQESKLTTATGTEATSSSYYIMVSATQITGTILTACSLS
jgi:hypothetical protein